MTKKYQSLKRIIFPQIDFRLKVLSKEHPPALELK